MIRSAEDFHEAQLLSQRRIQGGGGVNPSPPTRTTQLIVKFGEKELQIDYRCCK